MIKYSQKVISIVVPVYYNELNLPETIPLLMSLTQQFPDLKLELVFVDDGSGDDSLNILLSFRDQYPEVIQVVKLTRNFGSMAAIQAGLLFAHGDCVGIITADLQDPPELFVEMVNHWKNGIKAIFAVRKDRDENRLQKFLSNFYYYLIRKVAISNYPEGGFDFFLIDREVVNQVNQIQEKNTNIMTLVFWLGYHPILIPYFRRARGKGKSRWTLNKKIKLFVDTFVSFSYFPFRIFLAFGILSVVTALMYLCYQFVTRFLLCEKNMYWPVIIFLIMFSSGAQMMMLGILGEYLWRTLDESRKRPHFVVDAIFPSSYGKSDRLSDKISDKKN
jgi:polyisoprenyl-phosphate glycosyltransferase